MQTKWLLAFKHAIIHWQLHLIIGSNIKNELLNNRKLFCIYNNLYLRVPDQFKLNYAKTLF